MSYRFLTLYSGSDGNSTYLETQNTAILIDAGKSARALCNALNEIGSSIERIQAIFITHEHCDHISALETLIKKHNIPIHMTSASAEKLDRFPNSPIHSCLVRHDTLFTQTVGNITLTSFRTPHDSLMSVGYRIEFEADDGKHILGVATDIGHVSDSVKNGLVGCEAVVLEANHDRQMLLDGPYPYNLKVRIDGRRGHLSNRDSAELAAFLAEKGTKAFLLAHLSKENNEPCLVYDEYNAVLARTDISICIAAPDEPTEIAPIRKEIKLCSE